MSDLKLRRLAKEIELEGYGEMTSLELQKCLYNAGIGLHPTTIERYLKEALFAELLRPAAFRDGGGTKNLDKTRASNVSRWKRGLRFNEWAGNGQKEGGGG